MWCDHPFSQRNKKTEKAMGLWVVYDREREGWKMLSAGNVEVF